VTKTLAYYSTVLFTIADVLVHRSQFNLFMKMVGASPFSFIVGKKEFSLSDGNIHFFSKKLSS